MSRSPLIACDSPSADSRVNRFISAMPSSICCPLGENSQWKVEGMRSLLKVSASASRANSPRPVDPGAEIGRDGDVGRGGDDALGDLGLFATELVEQGAEARLRRHHRLDRDRQLGRRRIRAASWGGGRRRTARARGNFRSSPGRHAEPPQTCPIRGPDGRSSRSGTCPSAPASSVRRGCPCSATAATKPLMV